MFSLVRHERDMAVKSFYKFQDTVVALFAMSQFAKQVYSNNFNVHVTATLSPTQTYTFNIDQTNALLLQSQEVRM